MKSLNKAQLIGNLGANPELIRFDSGAQVCTLSIATSEVYTKENQKIEETQWHTVKVWGNPAEWCHQYLKKGSKVFVEGKMKRESFEKDGQKKYFQFIDCKNIIFLDQKRPEVGDPKKEDDDLPF